MQPTGLVLIKKVCTPTRVHYSLGPELQRPYTHPLPILPPLHNPTYTTHSGAPPPKTTQPVSKNTHLPPRRNSVCACGVPSQRHNIRRRSSAATSRRHVTTFTAGTLLRVWERGLLPIEPLPPSSMSQPCIDDICLSVVPPPPHPNAIVRREATPCRHITTPTDQHPFRHVATLTDKRLLRRVTTPADKHLLRRVTTPTDERLLHCVTTPTDERLLRRVATLTEHLCQVTIHIDESGLHPAQAPKSATPPAPMSHSFINNVQQYLTTISLRLAGYHV